MANGARMKNFGQFVVGHKKEQPITLKKLHRAKILGNRKEFQDQTISDWYHPSQVHFDVDQPVYSATYYCYEILYIKTAKKDHGLNIEQVKSNN